MTKKLVSLPPQIEIIENEGTLVKIGKKEWIVPPLPIMLLEKSGFYKIESELQQARLDGDGGAIGTLTVKLLEFVYQAILMNYPEATREETIELVNTRNLRNLIPALIDLPEGLEEAKNA